MRIRQERHGGQVRVLPPQAQAKFVKGGEADVPGYNDAVLACGTKYSDKWDSIETKAAGACPVTGDKTDIQDFLDACIFSAEDALGGGTLPSAGGLAKTGQTICYDTAGSVIACAGTGHDGEFQKGVVQSFTDNGDGTVTDNLAGLMWEKHSDDGSVHDMDNTYTWDNAFASKVATLNLTSFAGHNDWRVPNVRELESLRNFGAALPSTYSAFNIGCVAACTVTTCSCTPLLGFYWSSTTNLHVPSYAWFVFIGDGTTYPEPKTSSFGVRAVRAGS